MNINANNLLYPYPNNQDWQNRSRTSYNSPPFLRQSNSYNSTLPLAPLMPLVPIYPFVGLPFLIGWGGHHHHDHHHTPPSPPLEMPHAHLQSFQNEQVLPLQDLNMPSFDTSII